MRVIAPHATRAPALPVTFEAKPFFGGGPGCELSPLPRSSSSACTIIERPTTEYAPASFTRVETSVPLATPALSATMLLREREKRHT